MNLPANVYTVALMWGPGILILAGLYAIIRPISRRLTDARIQHDNRLVGAFEQQAAAIDRLSRGFEEHIHHDREERRSLMIAIRAQNGDIRDLSERLNLILLREGCSPPAATNRKQEAANG